MHSAIRVLAFLALALAPALARAENDADLAKPLDRGAVVRAALAKTPTLKATRQRAQATLLAADAESRLPPPEITADVWAVPITRPYAVSDAQMIMFGVRQAF